ncbi:hypothetical protein J7E93_07330 [Streptomyces sp. ISL-36]|uniref:hypothetical protein n=1 Tax=Streptomyces sp. ISL-36 TaxID=2819182 RepID=UPI001BECD54F|nr:hypothetical protein [Streptomyces sp. ISL-36]MBT2439935.1 hypothetical protein [Streptomyces sp. ISL-36]
MPVPGPQVPADPLEPSSLYVRVPDAAGEWQNCRYAMAGLALLSTLKQRDWPPAQHALDTLLLLYQLG